SHGDRLHFRGDYRKEAGCRVEGEVGIGKRHPPGGFALCSFGHLSFYTLPQGPSPPAVRTRIACGAAVLTMASALPHDDGETNSARSRGQSKLKLLRYCAL